MENTALLIIDVQKGFDDSFWGNRNSLDAEKNIVLLLSKWRKKQMPVIHVQHCSLELNSPLRKNKPGVRHPDKGNRSVFFDPLNRCFRQSTNNNAKQSSEDRFHPFGMP